MKATSIRKALVLTSAVLGLSVTMTAVLSLEGASGAMAAPVVQLSQRGDSGPEVVRLQQAIVARGFTLVGGVTGEFNGQTVAALRSLQKVAGFRATGSLDERTAKFLGLVDVAPIAANALPTVGMSGDAVWSLQQALINSGTQVKGGADGKFGLATTIAASELFLTQFHPAMTDVMLQSELMFLRQKHQHLMADEKLGVGPLQIHLGSEMETITPIFGTKPSKAG